MIHLSVIYVIKYSYRNEPMLEPFTRKRSLSSVYVNKKSSKKLQTPFMHVSRPEKSYR